MDRETLKQYRALKKELELIDKGIEHLRERAENVPTVMGKVKGSSHDWPYIETHYPVYMDEPKEADEIARRMRIKRARKEEVSRLATEIEEFIASIPDSEDRIIFEMCFLQGKKQRAVAETLGYTQGRIAQKINGIIKD